MDRRRYLLLKYFLNNCKDGYWILEIAKLFSALKKYKSNLEILKKDVEYLKSLKFIDVKYFDDESICLSIMDNSKILEANIKNERSTQNKFIMFMLISSICSGIMAFIGAFLANFIWG